MKASLIEKFIQMAERLEELQALLSEPDTIKNASQFQQLSKEFSKLDPIVERFKRYQHIQVEWDELQVFLKDDDIELKQMAEQEYPVLKQKLEEMDEALQWALIPQDPNDEKNIYLEVRAGTGGDEAAIFAGDLYRMYSRYAELQGWQIEIVNTHHGEHGGFKEIIVEVKGRDVFGHLKFESGTHRVQRVPLTESQGRVHTSACTVAILPVLDEINDIDINPDELRIDTFRASGAGGQHVNKTDSAIRITHLPTGTVVECQDERSQHKNRAKAMSLLQARLLDAEQSKQRESQAQTRKMMVGSGDRSERIRTYNYPQGRLTEHRINLTIYQLADIMEGQLDAVIQPLRKEYQASLLADFSNE
ncbi:MAG: peptide chain release factor 1 [Gammaproteobacteria bacterium]|nr:peptide chain release factor 1 [Gammaproteobacteria bacterium]